MPMLASCVVKMATVLVGIYCRGAVFCCACFLWAKELNAKDVHKDIFAIYRGKCLSCLFDLLENHLGGRLFADDEEVKRRLVDETTVRRLQCCGFRRTGKTLGQVYHCYWRMCREINILSRFEYRVFYVLYQFVTYLLTFPHVSNAISWPGF
jgi:hypothetical protein